MAFQYPRLEYRIIAQAQCGNTGRFASRASACENDRSINRECQLKAVKRITFLKRQRERLLVPIRASLIAMGNEGEVAGISDTNGMDKNLRYMEVFA